MKPYLTQTNKETGRFHLANIRAAVKTSDNKCWWARRKHNHYLLLVKSINSCSYSGNQCGNFQKTKDRNCYDLVITLLGIYPQASMLYYWETCTFTPAVFATAKRYDQLDVYQHEWLMKMSYIYNSAEKENTITQLEEMDGSRNTAGTQAEKDNRACLLPYTELSFVFSHMCLCENETVQTLDTGTGSMERG